MEGSNASDLLGSMASANISSPEPGEDEKYETQNMGPSEAVWCQVTGNMVFVIVSRHGWGCYLIFTSWQSVAFHRRSVN